MTIEEMSALDKPALIESLQQSQAEIERLHVALVEFAEESLKDLRSMARKGQELGDYCARQTARADAAWTEALQAAADAVKNLSHEDGLGMGSQRIERAILALPRAVP